MKNSPLEALPWKPLKMLNVINSVLVSPPYPRLIRAKTCNNYRGAAAELTSRFASLAVIAGHISSPKHRNRSSQALAAFVACRITRLALICEMFIPCGTVEWSARVDRVRWILVIGDWRWCSSKIQGSICMSSLFLTVQYTWDWKFHPSQLQLSIRSPLTWLFLAHCRNCSDKLVQMNVVIFWVSSFHHFGGVLSSLRGCHVAWAIAVIVVQDREQYVAT